MIEMLSGTLRERGRCFRRLPGEREREAGVDSCEHVRKAQVVAHRQSSPSGDFGKLISKSLERAKGWRASFIPVFCLVSDAAFQSNI